MDNMEPLETIDYKNCLINIYQDIDSQSPDDWGDDGIFLIGWNSREFWVKREGFTKEIFGAYLKHEDFDDYKQEAKEVSKKYWIFGLDAYIHSGVTLSMHNEGYRCRWDTSDYIGAVFVKKTEAKTKKQADKLARNLIEIWNDCLAGNVYGYQTKTKDGDNIDSCWNFIGDIDKSGIIDEAKSSIDYYVDDQEEKKEKKLKAMIKNNVGLEYRMGGLKQ